MRWIRLLPAVVALCFSLAKADPATDQQAATKQLLAAVEKNDPQGVTAALAAGADVNGPKGPTSLFKAVEHKEDEEKAYEIVEALLRQGADCNAIGPDGESVFQEVVEGRALCSPKVAALLVDYPDRFGVTPLMRLAQDSLIDVLSPIDAIKLLLAKGADPERRDKRGKSAIDRAIASGDYNLLLVLDAKGAHRDVYDEVKKKVLQRQLNLAVRTAIYNEAKSAEAMATIEKLLQEGADPNAKGFYYSLQTIFQESLIQSPTPTKGRRIRVVKYLLDHGADPNRACSDGTIPLEEAVYEPQIFALLRERGAKLNRNLELAQVASRADIENIWEATFRHQFGLNGSGQQNPAKIYYLEITDFKTGNRTDPSAAFLKRFAGSQPPVAAVSEYNELAEKGVPDVQPGEEVDIFVLDTIRWISETKVEMSGGVSIPGEFDGSSVTYTLEKKDGKWVVVKDVRHRD
jgi:ankyrin repeat protein